jgi:hypothetical protein
VICVRFPAPISLSLSLFRQSILCTACPRGSNLWPATGTGACLLYGISRVVIGENKSFLGGEAYLEQRGVEVVVMDDEECRQFMEKWIEEHPEVW